MSFIFLKKIGRRFQNLFFWIANPRLFLSIISAFFFSFKLIFKGFVFEFSYLVRFFLEASDYSAQEWTYLEVAYSRLSSGMRLSEYVARHMRARFFFPRSFFKITQDQISLYLKSTEMQRESKKVLSKRNIIWRGEQLIESKLAEGRAVLLLSWHHGAYALAEYAVADRYPSVVRFSGSLNPYNKNIPIVVLENAYGAAFLMAKEIATPGLSFIAFDGAGGGLKLSHNILGEDIHISEGLFKLIRLHQPCVLPLTAYADSRGTISLNVGPEKFSSEILKTRDVDEMLHYIFKYFENDLKVYSPWSFNPRAFSDIKRIFKTSKQPRVKEVGL